SDGAVAHERRRRQIADALAEIDSAHAFAFARHAPDVGLDESLEPAGDPHLSPREADTVASRPALRTARSQPRSAEAPRRGKTTSTARPAWACGASSLPRRSRVRPEMATSAAAASRRESGRGQAPAS